MQIGKASVYFNTPPLIAGEGSIVGRKEGGRTFGAFI